MFYLTENIHHHSYKDESINAVCGKESLFVMVVMLKVYKLSNVIEGGTYSNHCAPEY